MAAVKSRSKSPPKKRAPAAASKRKRSARSRKQDEKIGPYVFHEGIAIALGGLGLLLFLALVSYSPRDLPSWVPFSSTAGQEEALNNFIGPVGAVVAGYSFFFFGAACYLIPAILAWWGVQVLTGGRIFHGRNFAAFAILVASGSCLIEYQTLFFNDWPAKYQLPKSAGGFVGHGVGAVVFENAMGSVGSFLIMAIAYCLSMIVLTGIHPFRFAKLVRSRFSARLEERRRMGFGPDEEEVIPKPASRQKKDSGKKKVVPEDDEMQELLPLETDTPEPKIIDASQRQKRDGKESLSVVGSKEENLVPFQGRRFENYQLPRLNLLSYGDESEVTPTDRDNLLQVQRTIVETLETFGVDVKPGDITKGPTITRYEVYPKPGLRVNRITSLQADIARATMAERINILAPIPGKDTVGIEIANSDKVLVALRELFEDDAFRDSKAKLPLALGKDVYGRTIVGDLAKMPHLLVAGATGSGKSVCINSIIASLLFRFSPDDLKFIMIDPKVVEMQLYNTLPHMVVPVVTDPKKVLLALRWVINEMERRYTLFAKLGCRNFDGFNGQVKERQQARAEAADLTTHHLKISDDLAIDQSDVPADGKPDNGPPSPPAGDEGEGDDDEFSHTLPYIVVIIDELADLMQTAPADVETGIARIAQKARAAGIHLIVATQTPRADVVTGVIKANIPSRVAFQVSSKIDSRVILDNSGAENLVGKGDMLFLPPGSAQLLRAQGAFLSDEEAQAVVAACAAQGEPQFAPDAQETIEAGESFEDEITEAEEELIEKCLEIIFADKKASTSHLQRRLRLGYNRAARVMDILEQRGIIGPGDGAKPREILVDLSDEFE
ncbi:MAG: DNA translocase FtsK [Verrucomicrobiales bacterium]|nr:DNA translocase FtsK [Verrucomicrobiales bacterium]